jgi:hypothetical protein
MRHSPWFLKADTIQGGCQYDRTCPLGVNGVRHSATLRPQLAATIIASRDDGSPFTGTLSFAPALFERPGLLRFPGNSLIVNPSGPQVSSDANLTLNAVWGKFGKSEVFCSVILTKWLIPAPTEIAAPVSLRQSSSRRSTND